MPGAPEHAFGAARLLHFGLRPHARPAQEPEYQQLIDRYFQDAAFRETLREIAGGLGLLVLDVSDHGLVVGPGEGSVFALGPADFRPGTSSAEDRMLDGLVQLAIAATVFPRARDLDDDLDLVRPPLTVAEVEDGLRALCDRLAEHARQTPDPEAGDESRGLVEAWRVYQRRLAVQETKDARQARRATRRIIAYALERLREFGFFTHAARGDEDTWQPTRRYHVVVRQLAATRLFDLVREASAPEATETG